MKVTRNLAFECRAPPCWDQMQKAQASSQLAKRSDGDQTVQLGSLAIFLYPHPEHNPPPLQPPPYPAEWKAQTQQIITKTLMESGGHRSNPQ